MMPDAPPPRLRFHLPPDWRYPALASWAIAGGVWIVFLAIVAVHAPERVKLLGLFAAGWGLLAGWGLGRLARITKLCFPKTVLLLAVLTLAAGQVGIAVQSHRIYRAEQSQRQKKLAVGLADRFLAEKQLPADFRTSLAREKQARSARLSFSGYLQHRLSQSPLRDWPPPWPAVFWGCEILCGSLAGAWLAFSATKRPYCLKCESWHEPRRSILLEADEAWQAWRILGGADPSSPPPAARLTVTLIACRCRDALPAIHGRLDTPGSRRVLDTRPAGEVLSRLETVLGRP